MTPERARRLPKTRIIIPCLENTLEHPFLGNRGNWAQPKRVRPMLIALSELLALGSKSRNGSSCDAGALQHMDRDVEKLLKNRLSPTDGMKLLEHMRTVMIHVVLSLILCGMCKRDDVSDSVSDIYENFVIELTEINRTIFLTATN